jgi:LPS sulfotransferase NodH
MFTERAGSTYLTRRLAKHPNLCAGGEILSRHKHDAKASLETMRQFYDAPYDEHIASVGFKVKHRDILMPEQAAAYFAERNVLVVCLRRKNVLKQAVSSMRAEILIKRSPGRDDSLAWNARSPDLVVGPSAISIPILEDRIAYLQDLQDKLDAFIRAHAIAVLDLTYEELLTDKLRCDARLGAALGVDPAPLALAPADTHKNTRDDLRESVTYYDALARHFRSTPYAHMLAEVIA